MILAETCVCNSEGLVFRPASKTGDGLGLAIMCSSYVALLQADASKRLGRRDVSKEKAFGGAPLYQALSLQPGWCLLGYYPSLAGLVVVNTAVSLLNVLHSRKRYDSSLKAP